MHGQNRTNSLRISESGTPWRNRTVKSKSAGKPDARQTLRDKARQATYPRQRLEASGLPALSHAHRETSTFITIRQMRQQLFACRADN